MEFHFPTDLPKVRKFNYQERISCYLYYLINIKVPGKFADIFREINEPWNKFIGRKKKATHLIKILL